MPRLIRDRDADTDLPASVDHELLSRTHVQFPLPGEKSQVDTAISLFKLARIVGRTLEELYTTTLRRGGVAKITRLQAELDAWERENDTTTSRDTDSGDATSGISASVDKSLASMFLKVSHNVATIHVHRPALSFTTAHPQFVSSLKTCGQASASLIKLLSQGRTDIYSDTAGLTTVVNSTAGGTWPETILAMLLYPNGVHMLWQAGLTVLFTRLKGYPVTTDHDESIIRSCIDTLRYLHSNTDDAGDRVGQCADVLDLLREKVFSDIQAPPELENLQWNVWDWPLESALELANTLNSAPLYLNPTREAWM